MKNNNNLFEIINKNVRLLAKIKNVPMYQVEMDIGFGDGWLRRKREDYPLSSLIRIARYFNVEIQNLWNTKYTNELEKMSRKSEIERLTKELEEMEIADE